MNITKNYLADGAIDQYLIVKMGSDEEHVTEAAAATDVSVGVTTIVGADAAEERVDVVHFGVAKVKAGGTISAGGFVTADSAGKGVAASPASGVNNYVIGRALQDAVNGDIFNVLIMPTRIQG